jgi:SHS2 domain-containing protein
MSEQPHGFREIEHTADWEIEIWAPDLPGLLEQAARGMYWLTSTELETGPRLTRRVELGGSDRESLLVAFLEELRYLGEVEGLGFDRFELRMSDENLIAHLEGAPLRAQSKEIKAITYHNLAIRETEQGLQVNIVFDV